MRGKPKAPVLLAVVAFALGVGGLWIAAASGQTTRIPAGRDRAPEFPKPGANVSGTTWINSPALTWADLRGKVVMVDFWEYTCINCIRTLGTNKEWYAKYHKDGFEIVGVHAPEFSFAYDVDNVRTAVKRFGLPYPIVVDDWYTIWKSFHNNVWPGRYLVDAKGYIRFVRLGEGDDSRMEYEIQQLLREAHPGLKFPSTDDIPAERNAFAPSCGLVTEEMFTGPMYKGRGSLANHEGYKPGVTVDYQLPSNVADGRVIIGGEWQTDPSGMIYEGKEQEPGPKAAQMQMRYHARELYAVVNVTRGKPSRLYVEQDGHWLTKANKGVDVKIDAKGRSYLDVAEPRMYYLVTNPRFGSHEVTLYPTAPGMMVDSFTFGNDCQMDFPHQ
jgi:thiol-disulfide isomerase/thioredoxin